MEPSPLEHPLRMHAVHEAHERSIDAVAEHPLQVVAAAGGSVDLEIVEDRLIHAPGASLAAHHVFRRLWQKIKSLWLLAKNERASRWEIFWAVFIGAFAGCTPAVGFHGALAIGLATLFKKNRLFAWLGSRISNMVFLPFITYAEVQVAHRIRVGTWASISFERERALEQAGQLLLDWCLGAIPVGLVIGALTGLIGLAWAIRRDKRLAAAGEPTTTTLAAAPTPSSESSP